MLACLSRLCVYHTTENDKADSNHFGAVRGHLTFGGLRQELTGSSFNPVYADLFLNKLD